MNEDIPESLKTTRRPRLAERPSAAAVNFSTFFGHHERLSSEELRAKIRWPAFVTKVALHAATWEHTFVLELAPRKASEDGSVCMRIGRLPDNDLVLVDPSISKHHATLASRAGEWMLSDEGSSNGTHVNGRALIAKKPARLRSLVPVAFGLAAPFFFFTPLELAELVERAKKVTRDRA